jgi:hypothetical protein
VGVDLGEDKQRLDLVQTLRPLRMTKEGSQGSHLIYYMLAVVEGAA